MTLVAGQVAPSPNPALHALVVGCGSYPNFPPALPPAARSATAFAEWLARSYHNPACPLGSIDALVSPAPQAVAGQAVEPATMAAIGQAVTRWVARASSHEDNIAVFYFAGHGIERGLDLALLTEGFSPPPALNPFNDAIDLNEFLGGMESCMARRQIFIVDACRNMPPWAYGLVGGMGNALVARNLDVRPSQRPRDWPVLFGAAAEQLAYADPNGLSRFTSALLGALDGPATDADANGIYSVRADGIVSSIIELGDDGCLPFDWGLQRPTLGGQMGRPFVLHVPQDGPRIPVRVECAPPALNANAVFTVTEAGSAKELAKDTRPAGQPMHWIALLPPQRVSVHAAFNGGAPPARQLDVLVAPPCLKAVLS